LRKVLYFPILKMKQGHCSMPFPIQQWLFDTTQHLVEMIARRPWRGAFVCSAHVSVWVADIQESLPRDADEPSDRQYTAHQRGEGGTWGEGVRRSLGPPSSPLPPVLNKSTSALRLTPCALLPISAPWCLCQLHNMAHGQIMRQGGSGVLRYTISR